jgi:hypothetical protein
MKSNFVFYVYVYLDPRKPGEYRYSDLTFSHEPFYVGKGKKKRQFSHIRNAYKNKQTHKYNKIRKILQIGQNPIVLLFKDNLEEQDAFDLEILLIKTIGRFDLQQGPLTNKTDGGDGFSGNHHNAPWNKGLDISDKRVLQCVETRKKTFLINEPFKGEKNPMYGRRGKLSPHFGVHKTKQHKKKISNTKIGLLNPQAKKSEIKTPDGKVFITAIRTFIKKYGKQYDISAYFLRSLAKGKTERGKFKSKLGWSCTYLD